MTKQTTRCNRIFAIQSLQDNKLNPYQMISIGHNSSTVFTAHTSNILKLHILTISQIINLQRNKYVIKYNSGMQISFKAQSSKVKHYSQMLCN